jgi:hypothetical protein
MCCAALSQRLILTKGGSARKRRNEIGFNPLKTLDSAKSLIQRHQ